MEIKKNLNYEKIMFGFLESFREIKGHCVEQLCTKLFSTSITQHNAIASDRYDAS